MLNRLKIPSQLMQNNSPLEAVFKLQLKALKIEGYQCEHRFLESRKWRFDFAWLDKRLAVEIEGGTRGRSRHTSFDGFHRDCEKYNKATLLGWRVLRFDSQHVRTGEAVQTVMEVLHRTNS